MNFRQGRQLPEHSQNYNQTFQPEHHTHLLSYTCIALCSALIGTSILSCILASMRVITWLRFIENLALIKMIVTLLKYYPQVIHNYRRKSTVGWSISRVHLDLTGGTMSLAQMALIAINTGDWRGFYGNIGKFGIGLISLIFDLIFEIQHYILYRNPKTEEDLEKK